MAQRWPSAAARRGAADFDAAFRTHYDGLYRFLFRMLGSRDEAEDVAQEAFVRLWRQDFDPRRPHNPRAWLYRVAGNLALNARRGERRRVMREQTADGAGLSPESDSPAEAALQTLERGTVRAALAELPERQARLLLLRHAGLSYHEVAEAVGIAPTSVGTLLARAERAFEVAYRHLEPAVDVQVEGEGT
jgi:RNA polymerase sigma-70 factor (ECF subfamily)